MSEEQRERDVANLLIGMYDATRKTAVQVLELYTFTETDPEHDPTYDEHRTNLRVLIDLCERASDALVADYGG